MDDEQPSASQQQEAIVELRLYSPSTPPPQVLILTTSQNVRRKRLSSNPSTRTSTAEYLDDNGMMMDWAEADRMIPLKYQLVGNTTPTSRAIQPDDDAADTTTTTTEPSYYRVIRSAQIRESFNAALESETRRVGFVEFHPHETPPRIVASDATDRCSVPDWGAQSSSPQKRMLQATADPTPTEEPYRRFIYRLDKDFCAGISLPGKKRMRPEVSDKWLEKTRTELLRTIFNVDAAPTTETSFSAGWLPSHQDIAWYEVCGDRKLYELMESESKDQTRRKLPVPIHQGIFPHNETGEFLDQFKDADDVSEMSVDYSSSASSSKCRQFLVRGRPRDDDDDDGSSDLDLDDSDVEECWW